MNTLYSPAPLDQAGVFGGVALIIAWSIVATSILLIDSIGAGNFREQAIRDQETYQQRLQIMASERDASVKTASAVMASYEAALAEIARCKNAFWPKKWIVGTVLWCGRFAIKFERRIGGTVRN